MARDAGLNSALLFVDCQSAFYATVRQTLTGQESGQTAKFLHSLAEDLFDHPDEQTCLHCPGGWTQSTAAP